MRRSRTWIALSCALLLTGALSLFFFESGWATSGPAAPLGPGRIEPWLGAARLGLTEPRALYLLCLLPLLLVGSVISQTGLTWEQRLLSLLLRVAFLATLVLGLASPVRTLDTTRVCLTALVDVSASIGDAALDEAARQLESLRQKEPSLTVIAFAESAKKRSLSQGKPVDAGLLRGDTDPTATDVGSALRLARAFRAPDCIPRVVILSDGIETRGNTLSDIGAARQEGVRTSTVPLSDRPPADAAVTALTLPEAVTLGEPFEVKVELRATEPVAGVLRLLQDGRENALGGERPLRLQPGHHVETFRSVVRVPGTRSYEVRFFPEGPDHFPGNDEHRASIEVPGPPRVLVAARKPEQAGHLARALAAQQFDVDVRPAAALPRTGAELESFAFVVLSDLSRAEVSRGAEQQLIAYVQRGGGLLYSGGDAAYGPGGWQGSELEKILPVRMNAEKDRETPGVAMALVIDRSGSMTGLPLTMAKEACAATLGALAPSDLLEVIAFDSQPTRVVRMQPAAHRVAIESALLTIQPGGGTEIFSSLDMAYQDLASTQARKKHIVLLTDGHSPSDGVYDLSVAAFAEGITLTTVGLGGQTNRELLAMIAEAGGGRYHAADDPTSLPRIFTREAELLSREATTSDLVPVLVAKAASFLAGLPLEAAPYLRGFTRTQLGPAPSELILRTDTGEPVLARRRVGAGWTLAWTADLGTRFGAEWLRWPSFPRFVAQLVRAHQLRDDSREVPLEVELQGRDVLVTFDAEDESGNFESDWVSSVSLQTSTARVDASADFRLVSPGRYQARLTLPGFGAYALVSKHARRPPQGDLVPVGFGRASVSLPYPEEYVRLEPDLDALRAWAAAGGGVFEPKDEDLTDPGKDRIETEAPMQAPLFYLAVLLLLLDLFVRRVRLFDRHFERPVKSASHNPRAT